MQGFSVRMREALALAIRQQMVTSAGDVVTGEDGTVVVAGFLGDSETDPVFMTATGSMRRLRTVRPVNPLALLPAGQA